MNRNNIILDCTLRDGGLVNNFNFSDEFVKNLYITNIKAGIDYMEFGYKADRDLFTGNEFGKWKYCNEDDLQNIVGSTSYKLKIAVMADVGRTNWERDICDKKDSVIDMIRIASYFDTLSEAIERIAYCKNKGYEVTFNLMSISILSKENIVNTLVQLKNSNVDVIYLVDSYGALYPHNFKDIINICNGILADSKISLGLHIHNNQQLAFANTLLGNQMGCEYLDVTIAGIGRGAGNCASELIISYINDNKYNVIPLIEFEKKYFNELNYKFNSFVNSIPYMITGFTNQHPRKAIDCINNKSFDFIKLVNKVENLN